MGSFNYYCIGLTTAPKKVIKSGPATSWPALQISQHMTVIVTFNYRGKSRSTCIQVVCYTDRPCSKHNCAYQKFFLKKKNITVTSMLFITDSCGENWSDNSHFAQICRLGTPIGLKRVLKYHTNEKCNLGIWELKDGSTGWWGEFLIEIFNISLTTLPSGGKTGMKQITCLLSLKCLSNPKGKTSY